jgi:glycosyltransferase involved in cell wall biosynthesis
MPKLSVVMPVFNGERWLMTAVYSIIRQDYDDFELLILNDGSSDDTAKLLRSIRDKRVIVISYARNEGYSGRLNDGIEASSGAFIARMDADDISLPARFSRQLKAFQNDPGLQILGTWTHQIDEEGILVGQHCCATRHSDVAINLLSNVTLVHHPTVMMKRSLFEAMAIYDTTFEPAEDFEMWTRAILANQQIGVLPDQMLLYRRHSNQVSETQHGKQWRAGRRAVIKMLSGLSRGGMSEAQRTLAFSFLALERDPTTHASSAESVLPDVLLEIREIVVSRFTRSALTAYWRLVRRAVSWFYHSGPERAAHVYHATIKGADSYEELG